MTFTQDHFRALLREDFHTFMQKVLRDQLKDGYVPNWHIDVLATQLCKVYMGECTRLIINMPPRSLKSTITSVIFPAWVMGKAPKTKIISCSYDLNLACKLARESRDIMQAQWYSSTFGGTRISQSKSAENDYETTQGGRRYSVSIGGSITGHGADIIIVDDPQKAQDIKSEVYREKSKDWFSSSIYTRLDNKEKGAIIVIQQRLHPDDLSGYLLEEKEGWTHLNFPAINDVEREFTLSDGSTKLWKEGELLQGVHEGEKVLEQIKRELNPQEFQAQYLQRPMINEGQMINWKWFNTYEELPTTGYIVQSWDTAHTDGPNSDYSVCTTWFVNKDNFYLLDVFRKRMLFPDVLRQIKVEKSKYNATIILVEQKGTGQALVQQLSKEGIQVTAIEPRGDKEERFGCVTPMIENGNIFLPKQAHFLPDFRQELLSFPNVKHDDQVDSLSQAFNWFRNRPRHVVKRKELII